MSWRIVIGDWESVRDDAQRLRNEVFVIAVSYKHMTLAAKRYG